MRALTPSNIVAGFKKCGVHPFNRNAILTLDSDSSGDTPPSSSSVPSASTSSATTPPVNTDSPNPDTSSPQSFPPEKVELFQRRYEEGYDIPDAEYEAWLKIAHPEAGITNVAGMFQDVATLNPVGESNNESDDEILEHETPLSSPEMFSSPDASHTFVPSSTNNSGVSAATPSQSSMVSSEVPLPCQTPASAPSLPKVTSHAPVSVGTTLSSSNTSTSSKVSPLAQYLTLPDATPKSRTKEPEATKMRAITGARVLTSVECFAIIKEQEEKKKKQEEEKARKKKEREEKRKQKLEEKQKKR